MEVVCIYCHEEERFAPLIPKPRHFYYNGVMMHLIDENKPICFKCLQFEINEIKENA